MLRALLALCAANASESVQVLSAGFLIDEIATVPFDQIAIAASVYLGMFIGGLGSGAAADSCGRVRTLLVSLSLSAASSST